ncbi:MAG: ABC transporter permease [Peptostreptococcaceae bacterium]|nr:ABC transporter permease [Peptostreptococcaceae bacterium]
MKIRTATYLIKEGFVNIRRNIMMSIASVGSVAAALIILGMVFLLIINMNHMVEDVKQQFDSIQLYLRDDVENSEILAIKSRLEGVEGIRGLEFESKEEALSNIKEKWGDQAYLLEGLESNPLPNSIIIYVKDIAYSDSIVAEVSGISGIEEVKYYNDIVQKLISIANFIRLLGLAIIAILVFLSIFIIGNTIKLTVAARKREIKIMKYVGATNWFIRWPFFVEGMVLGLLGAIISLGLIYFGYSYIYNAISQQMYMLLTAYIVPANEIIKDMMVIFAVLGMGIGALGSILSMRKYLKV